MSNKNIKSEVPEKRWPYAEALKIATTLMEELRPHCKRIAIAGSLRRKKKEVGDIELICIPLPYSTGLFNSGIATVINRFEKVKGELPCKYTQRKLSEGINLDLFIVEEGNWGLQYAIRTGSADYSHKVLARGWVSNGYKSEGGYLYRDGERYECPEEEDLFKRAGVPLIPAEERNL